MKTLEECLTEAGKFPFKARHETGITMTIIGFDPRENYPWISNNYNRLSNDKCWTIVKEPLRFEFQHHIFLAMPEEYVEALRQGKRFKIIAEEIV